jgi:hypothetical protein
LGTIDDARASIGASADPTGHPYQAFVVLAVDAKRTEPKLRKDLFRITACTGTLDGFGHLSIKSRR